MKTLLFKLMSSLLIATASLTSITANAVTAEGAGGHGGGSILTRGVPQSFYGAGFYTEPVLESDSGIQVPQMDQLVEKIKTFPSMSPLSKGKLLTAMLPSNNRTYLKIDAATFDAATRDRLIEVYSDLVKQPKSVLDVVAVTDIAKKKTFLLPGFYKMKAIDQMAILFHEAYWILNPDSTYEQTVNAEIAFQAVLDRPNDAIRVLEFMKYYSSHEDQVAAALSYDRKNGTLPAPFKLTELFGSEYVECKQSGSNDCDPALYAASTYQFYQAHKDSAMVRIIKKAIQYQSMTLDGIFFMKIGYHNGMAPVRFSSCVIDLSANTGFKFKMSCEHKLIDIEQLIQLHGRDKDMLRKAREWNKMKEPVTYSVRF